MTYPTLNHIKENYKNGFRCIHSEIENNTYTMHLKNFNTEKIKTISTNNLYEINEIKRYLQELDFITESTGCDF